MIKVHLKGIGLFVICTIATEAQSQYEITLFTLDGGGGSSGGGELQVSGTVGQPEAGILSGGGYQLTGGFWGIAVESTTPTETPTESTETPTPTPTDTTDGETPTVTPSGIYFDVQPNPLDDFIDARDLIDWVSRTRSLEGSSDLLFEFSTYWEDIYLEKIQTEKGTEKE